MSEIIFDESAHTYTLDGRVYPSVTQILKAAGMIDTSSPWYTEWHRTRGTYVHKACELADREELDLETVDPEIRPYLDGWLRFLGESRVTVLQVRDRVQIEVRFVEIARGYAGTIDRVLIVHGIPTVVDIKCGPPAPWHAIQTAAYSRGIRFDRACVHLDGHGGYKLVMHKDANDWNVFLSALQIHHWKEKHGK